MFEYIFSVYDPVFVTVDTVFMYGQGENKLMPGDKIQIEAIGYLSGIAAADGLIYAGRTTDGDYIYKGGCSHVDSYVLAIRRRSKFYPLLKTLKKNEWKKKWSWK
ncbi:MAG: hypothetical protein KH373_07440 [Ruminococcus sp.]|nr:hypothetical protein [Ruminococcus sp.]